MELFLPSHAVVVYPTTAAQGSIISPSSHHPTPPHPTSPLSLFIYLYPVFADPLLAPFNSNSNNHPSPILNPINSVNLTPALHAGASIIKKQNNLPTRNTSVLPVPHHPIYFSHIFQSEYNSIQNASSH